MKVVVNNCFGSFGLSIKGTYRYAELSGFKIYGYNDVYIQEGSDVRIFRLVGKDEPENMMNCITWCTNNLGVEIKLGDDYAEYKFNRWSDRDIDRSDENLIKVVEELGSEANSWHSDLKIIEIPDDIKWFVRSDDGFETVEEEHRFWSFNPFEITN